MSKKSLLEYLQKAIADYERDNGPLANDHYEFILMGFEFDDQGFPRVFMDRSQCQFTTKLASIDLMGEELEKSRTELYGRMNRTRQERATNENAPVPPPSSKKDVDNAMEELRKMATELRDKILKREQSQNTSENQKVEDIFQHLKSTFGFDGDKNMMEGGSFSVEGFREPDED